MRRKALLVAAMLLTGTAAGAHASIPVRRVIWSRNGKYVVLRDFRSTATNKLSVFRERDDTTVSELIQIEKPLWCYDPPDIRSVWFHPSALSDDGRHMAVTEHQMSALDRTVFLIREGESVTNILFDATNMVASIPTGSTPSVVPRFEDDTLTVEHRFAVPSMAGHHRLCRFAKVHIQNRSLHTYELETGRFLHTKPLPDEIRAHVIILGYRLPLAVFVSLFVCLVVLLLIAIPAFLIFRRKLYAGPAQPAGGET